MKQLIFTLVILTSFFANSQRNRLQLATEQYDFHPEKLKYLLNYVNPFIGTGGHGHTYPGASAPFGMIQLSPDTRYDGWDGCSGYHYSDDVIYGFSHTHLSGTGVEDYCDLLIVPQYGKPSLTPGYKDSINGYGSKFSHANEKASPGYYSVVMDNKIGVELTVSQRAGIHRYSFPKGTGKRYILIDLNHRDRLLKYYLKNISSNTVEGMRMSSSWAKEQYFYFLLNTSVDFEKAELIEEGRQMLLVFPENIDEIELKVGISATNEKGARSNFEREASKIDFKSMKERTEQIWIRELSSVLIDTTNKDLAIIFYTALYHSYLAPNIFSDVAGTYRGLDMRVHHTEEKEDVYTVFSLWDTYRATHPWYTIFQTRRTVDFINTFEKHFLHSGDLPVWELAGNETHCMIGYHSASVIADAYTKGIKKINVPLFIQALETTANLDEFGKLDFNNNGFINFKNEPESVSKTLEYAYDSYCIYTFLIAAKKDGHQVSDSLINVFQNRSFNFINILDPQTGFVRARNGGIWYSPFIPEEVNFNFTEANSWQYSLYAPHAVPVLANLLGGKDGLEKWLDNLFMAKSKLAGNNQADITGLLGQYAHGNEPSHHMAYLYNYTNAPEKTAIIVDSLLRHYYSNAPDGLSGNEDCGQMSSWFTFSSLGLYPVSPGNTIYDFGRPLFNYAELNLENGHRIRITATNNSATNKFIQSIKVDGKPYNKRYITHEDLIRSRTIEFVMGPFPSSEYRKTEIAPSIDSIPNSFVGVPYFKTESAVFSGKTSIEIGGRDNKVVYYYTLDGKKPTNKSKKYKKPISLKANTVVSVVAFNPKSKKYSQVISNEFRLKPTGVSLELNSTYAKQYSAAGDETLIDGVFGNHEFRTGDWQGFYNKDVEGKVTFEKVKTLKKIGLSALQSTRSWIFPPKSVTFTIVFEDNSTETQIVELKEHPKNVDNPETPVKYEFELMKEKNVKSIQFKAINYGVNPEWHLSPGYPTYIFLDELYFE